jgi:ribose transport system substrate-binding protein
MCLAVVNMAAFLLLTGCTASEHEPSEKYVLVATNIKLPYWQSALAGMNHAATEMKVKAELDGPDTYDPKAELDEFQRIVALKPTAILVSPGDSAVMGPAIDAALGQGIPVITMDSDAPASKRLLFIGTDNHNAGMLSAQTTAKLLGGKGNVVVLTIKGQANLDQRLHGFQDAIDATPGVKVTSVIDMKGDPGTAFDAAKQQLEGKTKVDAFACLEAISCPEVAEVVNRANMGGKVTIVSMDTDQRALDWIQKGVISATIAQKPFTMAYYGMKLLGDLKRHPLTPLVNNWAQDSFSPIPTFIDTGVSLINKDNVATFLEQRQSSTK